MYGALIAEPSGIKITPENTNMHVVFAMEEAAKSMLSGVEQWTWVIDMSGLSFRHLDPRFPQMLAALFANHYPERLGVPYHRRPRLGGFEF
jgi:hypothetical protein